MRTRKTIIIVIICLVLAWNVILAIPKIFRNREIDREMSQRTSSIQHQEQERLEYEANDGEFSYIDHQDLRKEIEEMLSNEVLSLFGNEKQPVILEWGGGRVERAQGKIAEIDRVALTLSTSQTIKLDGTISGSGTVDAILTLDRNFTDHRGELITQSIKKYNVGYTVYLSAAPLKFAMLNIDGDIIIKDGENARINTDDPPSTIPNDGIVPRFIGQSISDIQSNESYQEVFDFSVHEQYNSSFEAGIVYDQTPPKDTPFPDSGAVILYVSKGALVLEMPDLVGCFQDEAIAILESLSTDVEIAYQVMEKVSNTSTPNTILATSPKHGEQFDPQKQVVMLYVSVAG